MHERGDYELGADIQRLLAHSRRTNQKLDQIGKQVDRIRAGQITEKDLDKIVVQLDSIIKQVKRTVTPKE